MAITLVRTVQFKFRGDGTSTSFSFDLADAPVEIIIVQAPMQPGFSFKVFPPSAVLSVSTGAGTPTASLARTTLTLNFASAPPFSDFDGTVELAF